MEEKNEETITPNLDIRSIPKQDLEREAHERRIIDLKMQGKSYPEIADILGYSSRQAAYKAFNLVMAKYFPLTKDYISDAKRKDIASLEAMEERLIKSLDTCKDPLPVIDRALKIMDRRSSLLGMDAPTQNLNMNLNVDKTYEELLDDISKKPPTIIDNA